METRRNTLHAHTLQLLAVSITGFGVLISQQNSIYSQWGNKGIVFFFMPLVLMLVSAILVSLLAIVLYEEQNGFRYPFLPLGTFGSNRWKWFYYGNPPITEIETRPILPSHDFHNTLEPYMEGLKNFIHKTDYA